MQLAEVKKEEGRGNSPSVPEVRAMKAQWGVSLAYQPGSDELNFLIGPTFKKQCTTIFPAWEWCWGRKALWRRVVKLFAILVVLEFEVYKIFKDISASIE